VDVGGLAVAGPSIPRSSGPFAVRCFVGGSRADPTPQGRQLMNPKHFHTPPSTRAVCPVCRAPVYSRAGIHPQCAVRQADPPKPKEKPKPAGEPTAVEPAV
jgi:hypothetical protein